MVTMEHPGHSPHHLQSIHHPFHHSPLQSPVHHHNHHHHQNQQQPQQAQFQPRPQMLSRTSSSSVPHTPTTSAGFNQSGPMPSASSAPGSAFLAAQTGFSLEIESGSSIGGEVHLQQQRQRSQNVDGGGVGSGLGGGGEMMFMDLGGSTYDALESMLAETGGVGGGVGSNVGTGPVGAGQGGSNQHDGGMSLGTDLEDALARAAQGDRSGRSHYAESGSDRLDPTGSLHRQPKVDQLEIHHPGLSQHHQQQEPSGLSSIVSPGQYFDFDMSNFGASVGLLDEGSRDGDGLHLGTTARGDTSLTNGTSTNGLQETGFEFDGFGQAGSGVAYSMMNGGSETGADGIGQADSGDAEFGSVHGAAHEDGREPGAGVEHPFEHHPSGAVGSERQEESLLDALHAGLLQQQLEQFQLQSPALLAGLSGHGSGYIRGAQDVRDQSMGQGRDGDHALVNNGHRHSVSQFDQSSPMMGVGASSPNDFANNARTSVPEGIDVGVPGPNHQVYRHRQERYPSVPGLQQLQQPPYGQTPPFDRMSKETLMGIAQSMGLLTPGNSTELNAHMPSELVSPLPQDFLASLEGSMMAGQRNFTPMISPAITSNGANSLNSSPNIHLSTSQPPPRVPMPAPRTDTQNQLDSIRRQQLEIQRQLDRLSQQQAPEQPIMSNSPANSASRNQYASDSVRSPVVSMTSGQPPGQRAHSIGRRSDTMTPLTSPALNPYPERFHTRSNSISSVIPSPAMLPYDPQVQHQPFQNGIPNAHFENGPTVLEPAMMQYLAGLSQINLLEIATGGRDISLPYNGEPLGSNLGHGSNDSAGSGAHTPISDVGQMNEAPAFPPTTSPQAFRKDARPPPGPGPHRSNQSGRTRPSPMLRPIGRPPRPSTGSTVSGSYTQHHAYGSVPPSPLVSAHMPGRSIGGEAGSVAMQDFSAPPPMSSDQLGVASNGSSASGSLSPVDMTPGMMAGPSPPSPKRSTVSRRRSTGIAPITPATLMQMGRPASGSVQTRNHQPEHQRAASKDAGKNGQRALYAVPDVPSSGSSSRGPTSNGGTARHPSGDSVLSSKTLEGLRSLKVESINYKAAIAKGFVKPNRPFKKQEEETFVPPEIRKTSHKAAEQKRRDSLKASFDELRLLLPPINIEALDPESGEPIPGSSAPRLLPKSSLVPDDNPNKGVSKVALLKFSNDYMARLHTKMDRRENYIDLLKQAIRSMRSQAGGEHDGAIDELLDYEFEDEEDEEVPPPTKGKGKDRVNPADSEDEEYEDEVDEGIAEVTVVKKQEPRRGRPPGSSSIKSKAVNGSKGSGGSKAQAGKGGTTGAVSRRNTGPTGMPSGQLASPLLLANQGGLKYGQNDVEMH